MLYYIICNIYSNVPLNFFYSDLCRVRNGDCEHICIPKAEGTRTCQCRLGFKLKSDKKACISCKYSLFLHTFRCKSSTNLVYRMHYNLFIRLNI